jgi:hypothetical protein
VHTIAPVADAAAEAPARKPTPVPAAQAPITQS